MSLMFKRSGCLETLVDLLGPEVSITGLLGGVVNSEFSDSGSIISSTGSCWISSPPTGLGTSSALGIVTGVEVVF